MSGHSKWATTKHRKGAQDRARAKLFAKLIRQVEVAVREGGSDANANAALRTAFQKARDGSVPIDTIDRAVKRASGDVDGVRYESITYEGYGPNGIAILVESLTDNRNRTSAEVRAVFSKNGGAIAEPGAVAWQFDRKGSIEVPGSLDEDSLLETAMEVGGENLTSNGESFLITTEAAETAIVREALEAAGVKVLSSDLVMIPQNFIEITDEADAKKILRLMEAIDDLDDVQNVYANFDIPDAILATYEG
jgi:YebC/PmpR family DNA-binding regulatory protein